MNKNSSMNTLAIMSVFLIAMSAGTVGATVQPMIEAFPDVASTTVRLSTTIPAMTAMVMVLISGFITGRFISFRKICLLGSIFMLIGGVTPLLATGSIYFILLSRLLLGIGVGCFGIRNALVLKTYPEEKRASMLGMGMFTANLASIIMSTFAGLLADIRWNYAFLVYSICIITVIMVAVFLKEPEASNKNEKNTIEKKKGKIKIPVSIYILAVFQLLVAMGSYPIITGISTFLVEKQLGTAGTAGTVISVFSVGAVVMGLIFGKTFAKLKKWNIPAYLFSIALGITLVLWTDNLIGIYIGALLTGIGFAASMSTYLAYAGEIADANSVTSATTIIMTLSQIGVLASGYFISISGKVITFFGSEVESSYLMGIMLYIIMIIFAIVIKLYPKSYRTAE